MRASLCESEKQIRIVDAFSLVCVCIYICTRGQWYHKTYKILAKGFRLLPYLVNSSPYCDSLEMVGDRVQLKGLLGDGGGSSKAQVLPTPTPKPTAKAAAPAPSPSTSTSTSSPSPSPSPSACSSKGSEPNSRPGLHHRAPLATLPPA